MSVVGQVTITPAENAPHFYRPVAKITLAWISDGSGDVSGTLTAFHVSGALVRVVFVPGTGGVKPTDNYDVTLLDENGIDILSSQGVNLSQNNKSEISPGCPLKDGVTISVVPPSIDDYLQLVVAGAGAAKQGTVILYVR